ncbi:MAG TPA: 3-oxoacyl-ACP reductase [Firmicutes bacterium]|jgi:3-oxoacyl-[acyl-carrier protein] reductase|nr:3-oxoacyl-ACP reductase [Bacillota bacterium]HBK67608.1 3-oxoacyl-ACP reductase [Bacillota bacterium]HBT17050.1 3-oxoacyl-ACP reductase [Bacillota bacterium]
MNKTVIITGASRGIGRSIAELFAANDYNVLINYHRSTEAALELYHSLLEKGFSIALFKANVSHRPEVEDMVAYCLQQFGKIDVLINNAGIAQSRLFIDLSAQDWEEMINTNLSGVFHCTQSVLRSMLPRKKGKIINISSIWGQVGASCEVHYSAAKAGVIGLTKALAKELGPSNIQVNCIAPGIIDTDMLSPYNERERADLVEQTPLGRLGTPYEIAAYALFLASESADFITGQVIGINGGFVI